MAVEQTDKSPPQERDRRVRFGIKAELFVAFAAMAAMTFVASFVAWYAFTEVDRAVARITISSVPSMSRAHALSAEVAEITASAPILMASASQEGRARAQEALAAAERKLAALMTELTAAGVDRDALAELVSLQDRIAANLAKLDAAVNRRLNLSARREEVLGELATTHRLVLETLEPLIDDAVFDTIISSEQVTLETTQSINGLVEGGVVNVQHLLEISAAANLCAGLLGEAANIMDPDLIQPIHERFVASSMAIERHLRALPDSADKAAIERHADDLLAHGKGRGSLFEIRRRELSEPAGRGASGDRISGVAGNSATTMAGEAKDAHERLLLALVPIIDNAIFDLVISSEKTVSDSQIAIRALVDNGVETLRALLTMRAESNLAAGLLNEAGGVTEASLLRPLGERFVTATNRLGRLLAALQSPHRTGALEEATARLVGFGAGAGNVFELRAKELETIAQAQDALRNGAEISTLLGSVTAGLVDASKAASEADGFLAQDAIDSGKVLLIIIIAITVTGAMSIILLYVAPRVVQPLVDMTQAMTRLAAGDTSVEIPSRQRKDEVGQMAKAFEVFRDTAQARSNLSRYFSPKLVEELAGRDQPLGPVRRQRVAVLFADIVGFTHISETQPPEQIMALLRDFHGRMEREVFAHDGVLEKFIGDALLATFGVPDTGPRDAVDALGCARAMGESLALWNVERIASGEQPIRIGIGLNFGPAVLGDIGSERNMAFAVIGDTTNTASRLETLTRSLSCDIVASQAFIDAVRYQAGDAADQALAGFQKGEPQALKGRDQKVLVWTYTSPETPSP